MKNLINALNLDFRELSKYPNEVFTIPLQETGVELEVKRQNNSATAVLYVDAIKARKQLLQELKINPQRLHLPLITILRTKYVHSPMHTYDWKNIRVDVDFSDREYIIDLKVIF